MEYQCMILSCSLFHYVCEFCMGAGAVISGIGTFGTFIYMICDSKRKTKQINSIQKIQSHQLESLYEPDIRISSYSGRNAGSIPNDIVISNHGEDLVILGIHESQEIEILNKDGIRDWFPRYFNKNEEIHIPLSLQLIDIQLSRIVIESRNRLGLIYDSEISINGGMPTLKSPRINQKTYLHQY